MLKHEINFNVRFDKNTRDELRKVANLWRCSEAEALRRMVRGCGRHLFQNEPTCADAGRCFVPHMHAKREGAA